MNPVADLNASDGMIERMERLVARQEATLLRLAHLNASPTLLATAQRLLATMNGALAGARQRRADLEADLGAATGEVLAASRFGLLAVWCTVEELPWLLARRQG